MSSCRPAELTTMARADAAAVAELRDVAGRFLDENLDIDAERRADLVLALDEALSNCAEHAYRDSGGTDGMMILELAHDIAAGTVRMCVTDSGAWVPPTASAPTSTRGRGLLLMRALADDLTVDGTTEGTTVCLHFERCPARATMLDLERAPETGRMSTTLDQ